MIAYIDTSVILRSILEGDDSINKVFESRRVISSELLNIEAHRVLERHRLGGVLNDIKLVESFRRLQDLIDCLEIWKLSDAIKARATESFPTAIGTLDALHLSTALVVGKDENPSVLKIYSHDRQMNLCARALGFNVPLYRD